MVSDTRDVEPEQQINDDLNQPLDLKLPKMVFSQQSVPVEPVNDNKPGEEEGGAIPDDNHSKETPASEGLDEIDTVDDETNDVPFWSLETASKGKDASSVSDAEGGKPTASLSATPNGCNPNDNTRGDVLRFADAFPWLIEFSKHCSVEVGTTDIVVLENLMTEFISLVEPVVKDCYTKPNRAAKLKRCISGTLLYFHMHYSDIKKPLEHSSYLNKMSQLMAFFIDMEFKASGRAKESLPSVANKLIASLYLYLDRSTDHILDSILKTNFMTKSFRELSKMIFSRILRDSPGRTEEMTYVRYILVFKMWKRVAHGVDERKQVMKMAETKLSPPHAFREKLKAGFLNGVLPKIPKSRANDITTFLMQAKFCPKEKAEAFIKIVSDPERVSFTLLKINSRFTVEADNVNSSDDLFEEEPDLLDNSFSDETDEELYSSTSLLSLDSAVREKLMLANLTKPLRKPKSKKSSTKKGIATPILTESTSQTPGNALEKKKRKRLVKVKDLLDKVEEVTAHQSAAESSHEVKQEEKKDVEEEQEEKKDVEEEVIPAPLPPPPSSPEPQPPSPSSPPAVPALPPPIEEPLQPVATVKIEVDSDELDKAEETSQDVKMEEAKIDVESVEEPSQPIEVGETECGVVKTSCEVVPAEEDICEPQEVTVPWKESSVDGLSDEPHEPELRADAALESQVVAQPNVNESCADSSRRDLSVFIKQAELLKMIIAKATPISAEIPLPMSTSQPRCNCSSCETNLENLLTNYRKLLPFTNNLVAELDKSAMKHETVPLRDSYEPKQSSPIAETHVTEIPSVSAQVEDLSRHRHEVPTVTAAPPPPLPLRLPVQQERFDLKFVHESTLRRDYSVFMKQSDFRKMFVEKTISRNTEVASPYDAENNGLPRCTCSQCDNNLKSLLINYKTLLQLKTNNFGGEPDVKKTQRDVVPSKEPDELAREDGRAAAEGDEIIRLPLKKRRAVTTEPDQPPAKKKEILTSYPSTPMMGIAAICEMALRNAPAAAYLLRNPGTSQSDSSIQPRQPPPPPPPPAVYQRLPPSSTYSVPTPSPSAPLLPPPPPLSPSAPFRRFMTAAELKAGAQNYSSRNPYGENIEVERKPSKPTKRKVRGSKDRLNGSGLPVTIGFVVSGKWLKAKKIRLKSRISRSELEQNQTRRSHSDKRTKDRRALPPDLLEPDLAIRMKTSVDHVEVSTFIPFPAQPSSHSKSTVKKVKLSTHHYEEYPSS